MPLNDVEGDVFSAVQNFLTETPESADFPAIGAYLGELLIRDDVAAQWDELRQGSEELHVLLDIEPGSLQAVPWELIIREERRLFLDEKAAFARVKALRDDMHQELVPLRLLVVEGKQDGVDEIGAADEIRGIKSALPTFRGRIDAEFLHEPSQDELLEAFNRVRPHVFHFIGHGMLSAKEPALRVGAWSLTSRFVRESLPHMPRVVVLNACRSGEAARAGALSANDLRALTDTFLSSGAAAAIGMQGDVRGRAAALFGAGLYGGLGKGLLLNQAAAYARRMMAERGGNDQARDWCLPSLTLSVVPDQVLPLSCGIPEDDRKHVESQLFEPIGLFVDRTPTRWDLAAATDPDEGDPARLVLLVGDMEAGKTWLVNWVRARCAFRGKRVRYVDFKNEDTLNFVRALEVIRDAPEDLQSLAGPAGAFDRFTWDLGHLVNGQIPPEEMEGEPPPVTEHLQLGGDNEERVFESFRAALETASSEHSLLIIFDHVDGVSRSDFRTRIFSHLIAPIAEGNPPNVRLIIVLSSEQQRAFWPSDAGTLGTKVDVKLFSADEFAKCVEDVMLAMGQEIGEKHEVLIKAFTLWKPPPVSPKELRDLQSFVPGG